MNKSPVWIMLLICALTCLLHPQNRAQSPVPGKAFPGGHEKNGGQVVERQAQFAVSRSVIGSGGGLMSGSSYKVIGTIGQPTIGKISGANYEGGIGFWYRVEQDCTPGLLGDVSGDNFVNSLDALIMLSYDAGLPVPQPILDRIAAGFGDVSQDGFTNSIDALVTISWEVGFPVPFPVGQVVCLPLSRGLSLPGSMPAASTSTQARPSSTHLPESSGKIAAFTARGDIIAPGQVIEVPVIVNMSETAEKLGSFTGKLSWNPAALQFIDFNGGSTKGFENPVVNDSKTGNGELVFANANPHGAEGMVNILNVQLTVIRNAPLDGDPVFLSFSAMAAAGTFTDLLPYLSRPSGIPSENVSRENVAPAAEEPPATFALENYPNPFNPSTEIRYQLPEAAEVKITVYNVLGQEVQTLVRGRQEAGNYLVRWEGRNEQGQPVPSGMYFLRMKAGSFIADRKLLLLK